MPYSYADVIGDNRNNYAPPRLGRRQAEVTPAGLAPGATDIYLGLPWTMWMNSEVENMFVASIGEWVGTTLFLFFAFAGTQVANAHSRNSNESTTTNATVGFSPIIMPYISVSFGFSLMVNVWIFFRISGGLFNPAVCVLRSVTSILELGLTPSRLLSLCRPLALLKSSVLFVWSFHRSLAASLRLALSSPCFLRR